MENKTESELRAKAKLRNYINHLEGTKRTQFKSSLKDLRSKGDSWEFITEMVYFKTPDVWDKYGYGLLFNKGYRTQVWNLMNAAFEEDEELDSLFDDEPEESSIQTEEVDCQATVQAKAGDCVAIVQEDEFISEEEFEEIKNSNLPLFYNRRGEAYSFAEIARILKECPTPEDTFRMMWGRFEDSQEATEYYKDELEKLF